MDRAVEPLESRPSAAHWAELRALVPELATGVRAALATVVPLSLAHSGFRPELTWMALGGWLGTLTDPGGSRRTRAQVLAGFALLGGGILWSGVLSAQVRPAAIVLLGVIAFAAALLRSLGSAVSTLGTMLAIVAALATTRPSPDPRGEALWFVAGATVALVLSSIVWPVWTHWPVRVEMAKVFGALADYARAIGTLGAAQVSEGDARWTEVARAHPRRVRDAIERARALALTIRARRPRESRVGSNLRVLLGLAEGQFLSLVTLASELEALPVDRRPEGGLSRALDHLAERYSESRTRVRARAFGALLPPPKLGPAPNAVEGSLDWLWSSLDAESERSLALAGALDSTAPVTAGSELGPAAVALRLDLGLLRDELTPRSPIFRHAVRVSAASVVAFLIGGLLSPGHTGWVVVTALVVLQQAAGATVRRAGERVVGTIVGGFLAIALTQLIRNPLALAATLFPLSIAAVVTRPRSYRLFTVFLTPVFVMVAMRSPGDWWTAAERAGDTVLGGAIALVMALMLFPNSEARADLPGALANMLQRVQAYAALVQGGPVDRRTLAETRRAAALAIDEAESSLERLLAEPLRRTANEGRALEQVTYARRLVLAATTLDMLATRSSTPEALDLSDARERLDRFGALLKQASGQGTVAAQA